MTKWIFIITPFLVFSMPQLRAGETLKVAAYEFAPYASDSIDDKGLIYQIVSETFKNAGYELDIQFFPKHRAIDIVRSGERDILLPTYASAKNEADFWYSSEIERSPVVKISRKDHKTKPNGDYEVATALDESIVNPLQATELASAGKKAYPVENALQLIDMLNRNRLDYGIAEENVAVHTLVSKRPHLIHKLDFKRLGKEDYQLRIAFSRKNPRLQAVAKAFDRELDALRQKHRIEQIHAERGIIEASSDPNLLTIATVSVQDIEELRRQSSKFEKAHPGTRIRWVVLDGNLLRKRIFANIALNNPSFDILTIGSYDAVTFLKSDWVEPFTQFSEDYDEPDILPLIRHSLSRNGVYVSLPFYGETSITYYRKDLLAKYGLTISQEPRYEEIRELARQLHSPQDKLSGLCLRSRPGWDRSGATINTMVNSFGGIWFDKRWQPQMNSQPWHKAITFYIDLIRSFASESALQNGYSENLKLFAEGRCAIWVDATVAASHLEDPRFSQVVGKVGYAFAPWQTTTAGSQWNWSWSFATSQLSKRKKLANAFILWATSKEYIKGVAAEKGWIFAPPGTRRSTYNEKYLASGEFAGFTQKALERYKPPSSDRNDLPYKGFTYIEIPEYPAIVAAVGEDIAQAVKGEKTIDEALRSAQQDVYNIMYHSGYYESKTNKGKR